MINSVLSLRKQNHLTPYKVQFCPAVNTTAPILLKKILMLTGIRNPNLQIEYFMKGLTDLDRSDNSFTTGQIMFNRLCAIKGMKTVYRQKPEHITGLTMSNFQNQHALPV